MSEPKFKMYKVGSVFAPRWWQVRRRLRIWRLRKDVKKEFNKLSPVAKQLSNDMNAEIEQIILFGED